MVNLWNTPSSKSAEGAPDLVAGQVVLGDRYVLVRPLGEGSTGPVWLATDRELGVDRALKFLSDEVQLDPYEIESLKAEARRCQQLTHQNIVRIHDFVRDGKHAAIAMEAVDGPDLRAALQKRIPPCFHPHEIRFWVEELCRALHHAHSVAKIIHRDLKPSNLLVTTQGNLKVADFGIAQAIPKRRLDHRRQGYHLAGTLDYISPQQIQGKVPSVADDVYSLGATLFELLTGRPPFVGDDLYEQILYEPVPSLSDTRQQLSAELDPIPAIWKETIEACLAKEPSERPSSVRAVAEALDLELANVTLRDPVVPEDFQEEPASDVLTRERLSSRVTVDRRVRTLRDLPVPKHRPRRMAWALGGSCAVVLLATQWRGCSTDTPLAEAAPERPIPEKAVSLPPITTPTLQPLPQALPDIQAVQTAFQQQDWSGARQQLTRLRRSGHDRTPWVLFAQARTEANLGEHSECLITLRQLLEIDPRHAGGTLLKARMHALLEEWYAVPRAVDWALRQPGNASQTVSLRLLSGQSHRHLGNLDLAIAEFTKAIQADRQQAEAFFLRGLAYREEGSLPKAIQDLSLAIQLDPDRLAARRARARLLLQQDNLLESAYTIEEDLSHVLDAHPDDMDARCDRLRCRHKLQDWDGVLEDADALLAAEPDWPDIVQLRAEAATKADEHAASIRDLQVYAETNPQDTDHGLKFAGILLKEGRFSEAEQAFSEVLRTDPERTEAYEGRAFAYYSIAKELEKADSEPGRRHRTRLFGIADLQNFLRKAPREATADTYLLLTKLHFERGEYEEANLAAHEGLSRFPKSLEEFQWWIREIKVADDIKHGRRRAVSRPQRKDPANFYERFVRLFKRDR